MKALALACVLVSTAIANPYPDPNKVPRLPIPKAAGDLKPGPIRDGIPVLRVQVDWQEATEGYEIGAVVVEPSGTEALLRRAKYPSPYGSYRARLEDAATRVAQSYDAIGTGKEFRKLARAMTFRFPKPSGRVDFVLTAENPKTGLMEEVLRRPLLAPVAAESSAAIEVKQVLAAESQPSVLVSIYAEAYSPERKARFWQDAEKIAKTLRQYDFPGAKKMEFQAVFSPSGLSIGKAQDLGLPVPDRDTFLGLYYPYWHPFGRWYNVVYPTREAHYRRAIGQVAYDYPIAVVDNSEYWGIGNFNELTAIPNGHPSFVYLLLHEYGHFFGLNEEYEGGGPTELSFAPEVAEPWSQNITFDAKNVKWKKFVEASTPLPTPSSKWTGNGPWGAYLGGYADTEPLHHSHKPGFSCTMESGKKFCPICRAAIDEKIAFDLAQAK